MMERKTPCLLIFADIYVWYNYPPEYDRPNPVRRNVSLYNWELFLNFYSYCGFVFFLVILAYSLVMDGVCLSF